MSKQYAMILKGTLLAVSLILIASTAMAKSYTRSCQGTMFFEPTSFRGVSASIRFTGKGKVGYYAPNKARRRAAKNLRQCFNAAWGQRETTATPSQCTPSNRVYNYPVRAPLATYIKGSVCSRNRGHSSITVRIKVLTDGDTGCFGNLNVPATLASGYTVDCSWMN